MRTIQQLEARRQYTLNPDQREKLIEASGGHPGIIQAFLSLLINTPRSSQTFDKPGWVEWLSRQPAVIEECRKIWVGLSEEEKEGLLAFAGGEFDKISLPVEKLLFAKGLLRSNGTSAQFFSEIFERYVRSIR